MLNRFNPGGRGSGNVPLLQAPPQQIQSALDIAEEISELWSAMAREDKPCSHPLEWRMALDHCKDLIRQVDTQLAKLDSANRDDKKKITALNKDKAALEARLAGTDAILAAIGGQLTEEDARRLILKKLYDLAHNELTRYLNAEKRALIAVVENLWDKYAVSSRELEAERAQTLKELDGFLKRLGYLE